MDNLVGMYWLDVAIIYFALGAPFGVLRITAKRKATPFAYLRMASGYLLWPLVAIRNVARFFTAKPAPLQKPARKQGRIQAALSTSNDVSERRARRSWLPASVATFFGTMESVPLLTRGPSQDLESVRTELEKALFPNAAASLDSAATRRDLYVFREVFYRYTSLAEAVNAQRTMPNAEYKGAYSQFSVLNSPLTRSTCIARRDRQKLEAQLLQARCELLDTLAAHKSFPALDLLAALCNDTELLERRR